MKMITMEGLPGWVPPKHYDLVVRTITGESNGVKQFNVGFARMEKNGRCDSHIHDNVEQLFIVLKGALMFQSDQGEFLVRPGQAVLVYRGEMHSNYNAAEDGETEYLTVTG